MAGQKKIVVIGGIPLKEEQLVRLSTLGECTYHKDRPKDLQEFLQRCEGKEIICAGMPFLKEAVLQLRDVFISLPYTGTAFLPLEKAGKRNVRIANSPGCNREAVAEFLIGFMINLLRRQYGFIAGTEMLWQFEAMGIAGRSATIFGKGNIGTTVGRICEAMDMHVKYFVRGDDPTALVEDADVVFNCLPTVPDMFNEAFFSSMKKGSYFITANTGKSVDYDALFAALDSDHLAGAGIDDGGLIPVGDFSNPDFQKIAQHPKILATPHVAFSSDQSQAKCHGMMIDNVEAWINGKPIHLVN